MQSHLVLKFALGLNVALITALGAIIAKPSLTVPATAGEVQAVDHGLKQLGSASGGGNGIDFLCHHRRDGYIEAGSRFLELRLDLSAEQAVLLTTLKDTLTDSAQTTLDPLCPSLTATEPLPTAPEKLGQYQALAVAANTVFTDVRPVFDQFYGALSSQQQGQLDALLNR